MISDTMPPSGPIDAKAAQKRIEADVLAELQRVVTATRIDGALDNAFKGMAITLQGFSDAPGPELRFVDDHGRGEDFTGYELALLFDLIGENLDLRLVDGILRVFSPSWAPDH